MTIWLASREYRGLAEAGGIKDVVREMAESWNRLGAKSTVLMPFYGFLQGRLGNLPEIYRGSLRFSTLIEYTVHRLLYEGVEILLFQLPGFKDKRSVYTYTSEDELQNPFHVRGTGHVDAPWMNAQFQRSVADYLSQQALGPDVLHCHDGHTAWIPAMIKTIPAYRERFGHLKTLVTIHNAGTGYHQEVPDWDPAAAQLGLESCVLESARIGGYYDPLAAAGLYSLVNTVSPHYALEVLSPEAQAQVGGLGDFYRERGIKLHGLFNGIDLRGKDPRDPVAAGLPYGFDPSNPDDPGKKACRRALSAKLLYPRENIWGNLEGSEGTVLFTMQSRITAQKGVAALLTLIPRLLEDPRVSFLIMGEGEKKFELALQAMGEEWAASGRFAFINTYDESYSPLVFASGDYFLIPSLFEPCGLTDLKALIMGTVPIVHGVGGLKKITDHKTGLVVANLERDFETVLREAVELAFSPGNPLSAMRRQGFEMVTKDFSWDQILVKGYSHLFSLAL